MALLHRSRLARCLSCLLLLAALAVTASGCESGGGVGLGFEGAGSPGGFDPYPTAIRIGGGPVVY